MLNQHALLYLRARRTAAALTRAKRIGSGLAQQIRSPPAAHSGVRKRLGRAQRVRRSASTVK
jgi:hypothetical protein